MVGCVALNEELDLLLADGVIDEVLGRLKSGKEANISLVRRGELVLAAKVYKDRATRSFKNNADYKEGRKVRNTRTQRAIAGGGRFGRDAAEQAWKSAEADALYRLVGSGVRIPAPVMFYEGVLLMELVCDAEGRPAPRLIDVAIDRDAAVGVYADLVAQMISMLCCDVIHGDLSPYNILAAADGPTIIDFPQVVSAVHSSRAEYFFLRDFDNVVRFVAGFDPALSVHRADGRAIWRAYVSRDLTPQFVPPPPPPPRPTRGPDRRGPPQRFDQRPQRNGRPPSQQRDQRSQQHRTDRAQQSQRSDQRPPQQNDQRPPQRGDQRPQQDNQRPLQGDQRPPQRNDGRQRTDSRQPQQRAPQRTDQRPARPDPRGPYSADPRPAPPVPDQRPRRDWQDRRADAEPRRTAPQPQAQREPPRTWAPSRPSNPPPASRGGRRRPKRRW
jgi:RIO kinase 1